MCKLKNSHFCIVLLTLFLVACGGGGDDTSGSNVAVSGQLVQVNSTFSATFLQSIKKDASSALLSSDVSSNANVIAGKEKTMVPTTQSKSYAGKMEVTNILTAEKELFDWPLTQQIDSEGNITTISHRALTLKPGSYDFVLILTSKEADKRQYLAKALGLVIVDGVNPVINFVLSPNLGDTINNFEEIKYVSTLKFSWVDQDLAGFTHPQLGLSINNGDEVIYIINKATGLTEVIMNVVPGDYSLMLHLYDGDLMVGKNAEQDTSVNLIEGENTAIDMISLQADIIISLDPIKDEGLLTFIVPNEVVNEIGAAQDLTLLVRIGGGSATLQEKALSVLDENGVYKASGLFTTGGEKNVSAYLAFHRTSEAAEQFSDAPFASCNTTIYIEQTQQLACNIELKRESIITSRLLGTLMLNVLDEEGQPAIGVEVYVNGKSIGLTGDVYSTASIKTHQIAGNYLIKAKNGTHTASTEVQLAPLEVVNELLYLKPFIGDGIADFNFLSIAPLNSPQSLRMLRFLWDGDAQGNTYTVCVKDSSQANGCFPLASITGKNQLDVRLKATYLLTNNDFFILARRGDLAQNSPTRQISNMTLNTLIQNIKATNTEKNDFFSSSVAISADGNTLAVGASQEKSNATGINGNSLDNSLAHAGAVYLFKKGDNGWQQHAYLKASNTNEMDEFGASLSLSAEGNILVVGAPNEASSANRINGDESDNSSPSSGAAYVFTQQNNVWRQQAYLKASNSDAKDHFAAALTISADGNTLAVGAYNEDSNATGVNGNETNKLAIDSGAVYVFKHTGGNWQQQAYLKASNTGKGDKFGHSLSLSVDGNTLAVGGIWEDSKASGVDGNQADNSTYKSGAVYLFKNSGNTWQQQAYLKPARAVEGSEFGQSLSLSGDGNTLAVGTRYDSWVRYISTIYVFKQVADKWQQDALIEGRDTGYGDEFGYSIALSESGNTLVVGTKMEGSNSTGVNGYEGNYNTIGSGAVYVYRRRKDEWQHQAFLKSMSNRSNAFFSHSLALSADGNTLAVGDSREGVYIF